jgi:hypothetical protein
MTRRMGEGELLLVRCALQGRINRRGNVDAAPSQSLSDRAVDVLFEVEMDRYRHRGQLVFGGVSRAFGAGGWLPALRPQGRRRLETIDDVMGKSVLAEEEPVMAVLGRQIVR